MKHSRDEMILNPDICHLVLSNSDVKTINVDHFIIKSTKSEKPLDIIFDKKLIFNLT